MNWQPVPDEQWRSCPHDGSFLLWLGSMSATSELQGGTEYYCPRCDIAFLAISTARQPGQTAGQPEQILMVLEWHRQNGKLQMVGDKPLNIFSQHQWEVREKNLLHHVQTALEYRKAAELPGPYCVFDGSLSVTLCQIEVNPESRLVVGWCQSCQIAVAFARDEVYGWEAVCAWIWDATCQSFELLEIFRQRGNQPIDGNTFQYLASKLKRPPQRTRVI